jgi:hypothetical protein
VSYVPAGATSFLRVAQGIYSLTVVAGIFTLKIAARGLGAPACPFSFKGYLKHLRG